MKYLIFLTSMLSVLVPQSVNAHPLFGDAIYITSNQTGRFVCSQSGKLFATGQDAKKHCLFQLVRFGEDFKLWSVHHRQFVSGHGEGWPLKAIVDDESWSRFKIHSVNNVFTLQSRQSISNFAYVSVIGASRVLRIAEAVPTEWSYFIAYKAVDMTPSLESYISKRKYKAL